MTRTLGCALLEEGHVHSQFIVFWRSFVLEGVFFQFSVAYPPRDTFNFCSGVSWNVVYCAEVDYIYVVWKIKRHHWHITYVIAEKRRVIEHIAYRIRCQGPRFLAHSIESSVPSVLHAVSTQICELQSASLHSPPISLSWTCYLDVNFESSNSKGDGPDFSSLLSPKASQFGFQSWNFPS